MIVRDQRLQMGIKMIKIHEEGTEMSRSMKSDCAKCSGLCCVALFCSKIDGFPEDKTAGKPCHNLQKDYRCKIHEELERRNLRGCTGYDCFGAGQQVTQVIYAGQTWRDSPIQAEEIFQVFLVVIQLHQMCYFLKEAVTLIPAKTLKSDISRLIKRNEEMCRQSPSDILKTDIESYRDEVNCLLKEVCNLLQNHLLVDKRKCPTDFLGKNFKNRNMQGYDFNTKLLIAADFEGCNFRGTTFLGADTRDTNFSNADLGEAVFLSQGQVNAARGNRNTKLPKHLDYPVTWQA